MACLATFGVLACLLCRAVTASSETDRCSTATLGVSSSWLECCLRDMVGSNVDVVRICPPGACPGHFDLSPGTFLRLSSCRALFLFPFQEALREKLPGQDNGKQGLSVLVVRVPEGLCVPAHYLSACEDIGNQLSQMEMSTTETCSTALGRVRGRMAALEQSVRKRARAARLEGAKVLSSCRQAAFCRWLGLDPVGEFGGGESVSPLEAERLSQLGTRSGVRFVVASLQEGTRYAEVLAQRTGATLVVFSNFPSMADGQETFDALVEANLSELLRAAGKGAP